MSLRKRIDKWRLGAILYNLVCVFVRLRIEVSGVSDGVAAIEEPLRTINNRLCTQVIEVCVHCADKPATCAVLKLSNEKYAVPVWARNSGSVYAICKTQTDSGPWGLQSGLRVVALPNYDATVGGSQGRAKQEWNGTVSGGLWSRSLHVRQRFRSASRIEKMAGIWTDAPARTSGARPLVIITTGTWCCTQRTSSLVCSPGAVLGEHLHLAASRLEESHNLATHLKTRLS